MRTLKLFLLMGLAFSLAGCPSKPVRQETKAPSLALQTFEQWVAEAEKAPDEQKPGLYLRAVREAIRSKRWVDARSALDTAFNFPMKAEETARWALYNAILLTQQGAVDEALKRFSELAPTEVDDKRLFHAWRARAYQLAGNYLEAAKQRLSLMDLLEEQNKQANADAIWYLLNQLKPDYLALFSQSSVDHPRLYGWLELARINASYRGQPSRLLKALKLWRNRFALHEANTWLPSELASVSKAKLYEPKTIGILLPQTGPLAPSAKLIRQGIVSAFWLMDDPKPSLVFYDTSQADLPALLKQLKEDGVDFVIGPLAKNQVNQWLEITDIPSLVLNRLDKQGHRIEDVYQFGLPVEDEVAQVATRIWQRGFRQVSVLTPHTSLGERALETITTHLQRLGGEIVSHRFFVPGRDYSPEIRALLGIDKSFSRKEQVERWIGRQVEFVPRRRRDIDAIYMHARPDEGRRLKPLLDYYYAFDVPILADSAIFEGDLANRLDKDLQRVEFLEMPWLLGHWPPSWKPTLTKVRDFWPDAFKGRRARMFALGLDAVRLIPQLGVLRAFPRQYFDGVVGHLYMNGQGAVIRELPWAKYGKQGVQWVGYADELDQETLGQMGKSIQER